MAKADLRSFDAMMKDFFPASGNPNDSPDYVKKLRAERAEIVRTGARIVAPEHRDNCGSICRNVGSVLVDDAEHHDCCGICNDLGEAAAGKESTA